MSKSSAQRNASYPEIFWLIQLLPRVLSCCREISLAVSATRSWIWLASGTGAPISQFHAYAKNTRAYRSP